MATLVPLLFAASACAATQRTAGASALPAVAGSTALSNPMPLYNASGHPMNVHDGDVRQWAPGGPFYYYGMRYDRCHYQFCAQKNCSSVHARNLPVAAVG